MEKRYEVYLPKSFEISPKHLTLTTAPLIYDIHDRIPYLCTQPNRFYLEIKDILISDEGLKTLVVPPPDPALIGRVGYGAVKTYQAEIYEFDDNDVILQRWVIPAAEINFPFHEKMIMRISAGNSFMRQLPSGRGRFIDYYRPSMVLDVEKNMVSIHYPDDNTKPEIPNPLLPKHFPVVLNWSSHKINQ